MMKPSTGKGVNLMSLLELSKNTFQNQIKEGLTLVDFWAPWCGPCKIQLQILEEMSQDIKIRLQSLR
jgi:thioredoxin 1